MKRLDEITPLIEDKLRFMQLYLYDVKFIGAGKRGVLRVFIDRQGGVTIDDCEKVSNALSVLLDVENFSDQPYTLEVSSPGLDRPLTQPQHYKTLVGHYLRLIVKEEGEKQAEHIGKLLSSDATSISVEMEDEQTKVFPLADIIKARVDIRFK